MPVIFRYKGFQFFFYSNDHEPKHVHVSNNNSILKIEFKEVSELYWTDEKIWYVGFTSAELGDIREFVENYRQDIITKWDDFRAGKKVKSETINQIKISKKANNKKSSS